MTASMPLQQELDAMMARFVRCCGPHVVGRVMTQIDRMIAEGVGSHALPAGDRAPHFALPNAHGKTIELNRLLDDGPVVLAFYRGEWCPWCNVQLRAYQAILPEITRLGATLVVIFPQDPDHTLAMAEHNDLDYEVLSDAGNTTAHKYGLTFSVEQPVREGYEALGFPLPAYNGDDSWELPVPGVSLHQPRRHHPALARRSRLHAPTRAAPHPRGPDRPCRAMT
jgi:peroxiredoxin